MSFSGRHLGDGGRMVLDIHIFVSLSELSVQNNGGWGGWNFMLPPAPTGPMQGQAVRGVLWATFGYVD